MNIDSLSAYLKHAAADARTIHALSLKLGFLSSTFLSNNLINSYLSRSMPAHARHLFDETPHRNVVTWSSIISAYTHSGNLRDAIFLFSKMQHGGRGEDSRPNEFTFGTILAGCTRANDLRTGIQIHCSMTKYGVESHTFLENTLIDMYAKCGGVEESWRVFDQTPFKDAVSWTTIITCLANSGQRRYRDAAFGVFRDMLKSEMCPVVMTFASVVKVFDEPSKLGQAKQVHGCMVKTGIVVDDLLGSAMIAMYGKCGGIDEAVTLSHQINHDVVSWTSLLAAFVQNGYNWEAIRVFRNMIEEKTITDPFAIASVIGACSAMEKLGMGKEIHGHAVKSSFMSDVSVDNALITMYGRCGEVGMAERVFDMIKDRDAISWTAMLTCYSQNDYAEEALILLRRMLREGISPCTFTVTSAIRACSTLASLYMGEQMHSRTVKMGIYGNFCVENSLITMYAKSGSIVDASRVFSFMAERNIATWNAMITGLSHHGSEEGTLELFRQMQKEGIKPDDYTFTGLLVACSRRGLVAEGCEYFRLMTEAYSLEPKMEHYACMVDLFSRAGRLNDAIDFINSMPCDPDLMVLEALAPSCKL